MADDFDDPLPDDDAPPDDADLDDAEPEEATADDDLEDAEPEEADADLDDAEAEEAAADDADRDDAEAEEAAADGAPPAELPPEPPAELVAPSPSLLTVVLFVLNIAAALGFGYLLILDYGMRQRWSTAIFRDDLMLWGLPLAEEEYNPSASQATRPAAHIDPDKLKKEAAARGVRVNDKFLAVNEVVGQRIKPSQLSDDVLKDLFKGLGDPVKTLEEEVDRAQGRFLKDVENAAAEVPPTLKSSQAKRAKLGDLLLPLASGPWLIDGVEQKIAKFKAADLDRLLVDAGQRRILVDALRLLDERRPTVPRNDNKEALKEVARQRTLLDNSADPTVVKLDDLKGLMTEHIKEARGGGPLFDPDQGDFHERLMTERSQEVGGGGPGKLDWESYGRRGNIAFLLLTLSKARKPGNSSELLYPTGAKRVAVVVGLYEYGNAAQDLSHAIAFAEERTLQALAADRDGYPMRLDAGKLQTVPGFMHRYQALVQRIVDLVGEIKNQEGRLARLEKLQDQHEEQYKKRKDHYNDVVDKLLLARNETRLQAVELRRLEQQLFRAQLDLASAARTNEELERQIRAAERLVGSRRKKRP